MKTMFDTIINSRIIDINNIDLFIDRIIKYKEFLMFKLGRKENT
jgi:hypothetical protein